MGSFSVTIQSLIADYVLPPGNAERLLGTPSANQQETGADGTPGNSITIRHLHCLKGRADARRSREKTHPYAELSC